MKQTWAIACLMLAALLPAYGSAAACFNERATSLPAPVLRVQLLSRGLLMHQCDTLRPALAMRRVNFRGDVHLPTLAIEIVSSVKRIA